MPESELTLADLQAYLDEELPPEEMSRIEQRLRAEPDLMKQLTAVIERRDAGVHSLGEVWRMHRISCLTREQLGSLLLGTLDEGYTRFAEFHLKKVGCRYCLASLNDLQQQQEESTQTTLTRRTKYFQTSAGFLNKKG